MINKNFRFDMPDLSFRDAWLFILVLPLVVFVINPATLYIFNIADWGYDYSLLLYINLAGVFFSVLLIITYFLIYRFSKTLSSYFAYILLVLGITVLLNDILLPLEIGKLGLAKLVSLEPLYVTLIECLILISTTIFLYLGIKKKRMELSFILKSLYIFALALTLFSICSSLLYEYNKKDSYSKDIKASLDSNLPNIYMIHLDGMQTDYFLKYLHDYNSENDFQGFTLYEKNIANYAYTYHSVLSYLTSSSYTGQTRKKWEATIENSLLVKLKDSGYEILQYGDNIITDKQYGKNYHITQYPLVDRKYSNKEVLLINGISHPLLGSFTRLSLAKSVPNFLTNESLVWGKSLGKSYFLYINRLSSSLPTGTDMGITAYSSILNMRALIHNQSLQKNRGVFTIAFIDLPHWPFSSTKSCEWYEPREGNESEDYYSQALCANKLVIELFDKLKDLGQYDDSLILIYGDHGSHAVAQLLDPEDSSFASVDKSDPAYDLTMSGWSLPSLEAHARSLLLIKPPNSSGNLLKSQDLTQLLDLYPTIMGQIGFKEIENLEGVDILNSKISKERKRSFSLVGPLKYRGNSSYYRNFKIKYNDNGILRLVPQEKSQSRSRPDIESFFNTKLETKRYNSIKFYYENIDGELKRDVDGVFIDGLEPLNNWGAWTNDNLVSLAFYAKKKDKGEYRKVSLKISDIFVNDGSSNYKSKVYFNKELVGSIDFNKSKDKYNFPIVFEFLLPKGAVLYDKPNILEIHIDIPNSEKGLALVDLHLK